MEKLQIFVDEYLYDNPNQHSGGPNCSTIPAAGSPQTDPCPMTHPGYGDTHTCTQAANDEAYKKPCPQWDCNLVNCSATAKQLLANTGCYARCGVAGAYRGAASSVMSALSDKESHLFSGPSMVQIIEKVFSQYR